MAQLCKHLLLPYVALLAVVCVAQESSCNEHETCAKKWKYENKSLFIRAKDRPIDDDWDAQCVKNVFSSWSRSGLSQDDRNSGIYWRKCETPKCKFACKEFKRLENVIVALRDETHRAKTRKEREPIARKVKQLNGFIPKLQSAKSEGLRDGYKNELLQQLRTVIAIGDVHGDIEQVVNLLKTLEIANVELEKWKGGTIAGAKYIGVKNVEWLGGSLTTLVSVGDLFDRGPYGSIVLDLFEKLAEKAKQEGGLVVNLLGNHEHQLLKQEEGFATKYAANEISRMRKQNNYSVQQYLNLWSENGDIGSKVRKRFQVMQKIGDSIFVHAGFSTEFMNRMIQKDWKNVSLEDLSKPYDKLSEALGKEKMEEVGDADGPIWDRSWDKKDESGNWCRKIDTFLKRHNANRIVTGHTPLKAYPAHRCNGKVINIDTWSSRWMSGPHRQMDHIC